MSGRQDPDHLFEWLVPDLAAPLGLGHWAIAEQGEQPAAI